jgi:hypothetical protein
VRTDAIILFIVVLLGVTITSAIDPSDTRQAWPIVINPELNVTGIGIANHSIPSQYDIPPTIIHIEISLS